MMPPKLISTTLAAAIAQEAAEQADAPLRQAATLGVLAGAGYGAREIASFTGAQWDEIDRRLALLGLVDAGKGALDEGLLPVDLAGCIARLSEPNQQLMLNRWLRGDFRGARHAERYALAIWGDEQPQVSF
ncbi:hypothetical protein M2168_002183 [Streptomyces sp. CZ24]|nr:hypothetical protein [Streptomyces sp. CZ24]MDH6189151.1 hypothetical protein [Streptomyces sp. CZ24]